MLAVMPMYDWPEVQAETDALWAEMRAALREEGLEAPDELDRSVGYEESWSRPDLVLGQACGLPLAKGLTGDAVLVGAINFRLKDCAPGEYYSQIVVRKDDLRTLNDLHEATFAFNDLGSQSGIACISKMGLTNGPGIETGSHRASIKAVVAGRADFAAIDARTWRIALKHEPAAAKLRVLSKTPNTPAPTYIAGQGADVAAYRRALRDFIVVKDRGAYQSLLNSTAPRS